MAKKVCIDEGECIGCGSCEDVCPEVFQLDRDAEKSKVIKPEGGDEACIEQAMAECPMSCIYWE